MVDAMTERTVTSVAKAAVGARRVTAQGGAMRDDAERSNRFDHLTRTVAAGGAAASGNGYTESNPDLAEFEAAIEAATAQRDAALALADEAQQALKAALCAELAATQRLLAELDRRHARDLDLLDQETTRERARIIAEARDLAERMMAAGPGVHVALPADARDEGYGLR